MSTERPMQNFFASRSWPLPPGVHPHSHFLTLISAHGWAATSRAHRRATYDFNAALLAEFTIRFGNEPNPPLETWQRLCRVLGKQAPQSITQCKKVVKRTHVNLVDVMAGVENIRLFRNRDELELYTRQTARYFPRRVAKDGGGLLRCLLREIPKAEEGEAAGGDTTTGGPSEGL